MAEEILLGCLLRGPDEFWPIEQMLEAEMFTVPLHQQIFSALRDVCNAGTVARNVITPVSVKMNGVDTGGADIKAILAVMKANADGEAKEYVDSVVQCWQTRALLDLSKWHDQQIRLGVKPLVELDEEFTDKRRAIMARGAALRPKHISDAASRVMDGSAKAFQDKGKVVGFTTGLPNLDDIMGRILDEDLVFILGSQGDGKSSCAAQIGMHVARAAPVLMIQMEMSDEQIAARELAYLSGLSVTKIQVGGFEFDDYDRLRAANEAMVSSNFWILECDQLSLAQIESQILTMKRTIGCSLVIIDQLDKIKAQGKHRDKFERLAEITKGLKSICKRLKTPIICLAQRTRGAQRRDNPTPSILDADAPSLERDADLIICVYRKHSWLMQNKPSFGPKYQEELDKWNMERDACADIAEVICLKRRRGKAFEQRKFTWDGPFTRFIDDREQDLCQSA